MNGFFGEPWPSGVCENARQRPTPVGELCLWCDEPIEDGQQGVFISAFGENGAVEHPEHRECALRSVLGGVAHLERRCTCFGGGAHDDDDMTPRESALAAWQWVQENGYAQS